MEQTQEKPATDVQAPDLNKLAAGENEPYYSPETKTVDTPPDPEGETEELESKPSMADMANTPPASAADTPLAKEKEEEPAKAEKDGEQKADDTPDMKGLYEKVAKELGIEEIISESVTKENFAQKVTEAVQSKIDYNSILDPNVVKIQQLIDSGTSFEEVAKNMSANTGLPSDPKDKVRHYLMKDLGKSDEEAEDILNKMVNLDFEAARIDREYEDRRQRYLDEENTRRQADIAESQKLQRENIGKMADAALEKFNDIEEIWGIPVDAKHKQEFPAKFKELVSPGPKGEKGKLFQLIDNDDFLMRVAYFSLYGNGAVKTEITRAKEGIKQTYDNKLDLNPSIPQSTTDSKDQQAPNLDALTDGEGLQLGASNPIK